MDRFRNTRQPDRGWWRQLWPDSAAVLRLSPAATVEAVAPAGFEPVETVELPPQHYGLVLER